jgi:hypothetical protein
MARLITITYEIVTPESAKQGDVEERGWIDDEGVAMASPAEAIKFLRDKGATQASSTAFHPGVWYSDCGDTDYKTGADETRSYHLKGFTERAQRIIFDAINGGRA